VRLTLEEDAVITQRPVLALSLLLLIGWEGANAAQPAQGSSAAGRGGRVGSWSATSSTGRTLTGTWTAVADPATGTVTGTWTLLDAGGRTVLRGGWSAAKSPAGWTGQWRAAVEGRRSEYSGTWSAAVDLAPDATLAGLLDHAVRTVASGRWRAGRHSGAWSIRAFD
jgi:hypothetical protein